MATYAIGDLQGCMEPLTRLLAAIAFEAQRDRLWLVGDLVNRGPDSVGVLRWARAHAGSIQAVLGNHDLHLLGVAAGTRRQKKGDTLDDVLHAPDRDALLDWLAAQPFLHRQGRRVLVHAGLYPVWTVPEAEAFAAELSGALAASRQGFLEALAGAKAEARFSPDLSGAVRWRTLLGIFTRMRFLAADGALDFELTDPPKEAPAGFVPWFEVPGRKSRDAEIFFGHWASLGLYKGSGVTCVDSGCVWGEELTAVRLEDGAVFQVPAKP